MKAILLGSNGYLGQNVALFLRDRGVKLVCHDLHSESAREGEACPFSYQPLDITDREAVAAVDWNVDAVFFFAGLTGTGISIEKAPLYLKTNELGMVHVLDAMVKQKARPRILFPSTRLVYRGAPGPLAENHEKEFKTVYALNKFSCEQLLGIYAVHCGISYTVFRICVPYGNLGNIPFSYGTIGFLMKQAQTGTIRLYGDGSQRRTFTHVGDLAEIMLCCLSVGKTRNDVFNIGGEDFSLKQVAEWIAASRQAEVQFQEWPPGDLLLESGDTVFDSRKLDILLGRPYRYRFQDWLHGLDAK